MHPSTAQNEHFTILAPHKEENQAMNSKFKPNQLGKKIKAMHREKCNQIKDVFFFISK